MPPRVTSRMGTGERIALWRNYRGMTQEACAGLCGKSLSWWKKVEHGIRRVEKLADLILICQILRVNDLTDITGSLEFALTLDAKRDEKILPATRQAMDMAVYPRPLTRAGHDIADIQRRVSGAQEEFLADRRFVSVLATRLPDLILDATAHHRETGTREAATCLAEIYTLTCEWARHAGQHDMALDAITRASMYGHLASNPLVVALAGWQMAGALKDSGRAEDGLEVMHAARSEFAQVHDANDARHRAVFGHLHLQTALMSAHIQDEGSAFRYWDQAVDIAHSLPVDYVEPTTVFSRRHPDIFQILLYTALGKGKRTVEIGNRVDISASPSAPARSLVLLNVARGYAFLREDVSTLHVLRQAEVESPETIHQSGHAREMIRELLRRDRKTISHELHAFADRVGLFE